FDFTLRHQQPPSPWPRTDHNIGLWRDNTSATLMRYREAVVRPGGAKRLLQPKNSPAFIDTPPPQTSNLGNVGLHYNPHSLEGGEPASASAAEAVFWQFWTPWVSREEAMKKLKLGL